MDWETWGNGKRWSPLLAGTSRRPCSLQGSSHQLVIPESKSTSVNYIGKYTVIPFYSLYFVLLILIDDDEKGDVEESGIEGMVDVGEVTVVASDGV
ncbi:hypothetical protein NECAME_01288 [Necator americanus]|uniref:Uncharacterized protein n=1 Tax=Necator americanus TaxID=51031 RepID=W2TZM0_NECAM|nr:hypothetical protein NECAME_01288 [Necator americanus]ETN87129.1 hypothetical protein NECAME_01288 [Necator americanus]